MRAWLWLVVTCAGVHSGAQSFDAHFPPAPNDVNLLSTSTSSSDQRLAGAWMGSDVASFAFEKQNDIKLDVLTVYRPINSVGYKFIQTNGKKLQLVTEIFHSIEDIASGKCDSQVRALARAIADKGVEVWIRQLHEFNYSGTYPWCLYRSDGYTDARIHTFKRAWRRLVGIYRDEGAPVKFQLTYMASNPHGDKTPFKDFFPGADVVDSVGVDIYVNPGSRLVSLKTRLDKGVYAQLESMNKPIHIGEVSCTDVGLDKATWIRDAWRDLALDFPRIRMVSFFLEDKGFPRDWALHGADQVRAFVEGVRNWRRLSSP
jgi:hypothetical protein